MKIDRGLIIRMPNNELSRQYAEICAKSCIENGLPYEFVDAVDNADFNNIRSVFHSVGAKVSKNYTKSLGNVCCHASMIKCWRRVVEIDKPCIVLEHDALVVGDVNSIDIPNMAVVTFGHRVGESNSYVPPRPAEAVVRVDRAIGLHAYGLTPDTAKWLVNDAETNEISVGVDRYLLMEGKSGLPIYVCDPPQAVCWVRRSTIRSDRDLTNFSEALTSSWYEGLTKSKGLTP